MKKHSWLIGASVSAILLSACAVNSDTVGATDAPTAVAAGSSFCHKERLNPVGNMIECNWTSNATDACERSIPVSRIARDALTADPVTVKRCTSGQWLVQITRK